MEGGGTIVTQSAWVDSDELRNGSDSIFGDNLVLATGGKSGRLQESPLASYGGEGGTPNGINGNASYPPSIGTPTAIQLPNIISITGIDYGKYGGVPGIMLKQTRAPDITSPIFIQGGSGGIITKILTLPSGSFTIKIGKQGRDTLVSISADTISYTQESRNGCILVEYGEGISL